MRALVLGGTNFIGRAIVDALVAGGHQPLVCHRGQHEPHGLAAVPHLHADRADLAAVRTEIDGFGPEVVVDCLAMSRSSIEGVRAALPDPDLRWVVLSSMDVYRAFSSLSTGTVTDLVPLDETAALREDRFPYPDRMPEYSKLDVEDVVLGAGGTVLRLPMVFGPHDYQRREWPILRRVVAGRTRIPIGGGGGLLCRGFVHDIAAGVVLAATAADGVAGQVFNLSEERCAPVRLWAEEILRAAGRPDVELVTVPEGTELPPDLSLTGHLTQPVLASSAKARRVLGYTDTPWPEAMATSVAWHLAHPPEADDIDVAADDAALAAAG